MDDIEKLYEAYAKLVYKFLYFQTHDTDLSEDLMQETFYRAIGSLHKYDGTCKISVWLCQIAKHLWYQRLQKESRLKQIPLDDSLQDGLSQNHGMSPESQFFAQEDKVTLYRRIHDLNETEREIVLLRLSGELSFKEIGDIFGKNEVWARVTFYRAKCKIREELEQ